MTSAAIHDRIGRGKAIHDITLTRIAVTEHRLCFPGPMLEIPWHVLQAHLRPPRNGPQRLIVPALARALHDRGVTLDTPEYQSVWRNANALPNPPQWMFWVFHRPLTHKDLAKAYKRKCIR